MRQRESVARATGERNPRPFHWPADLGAENHQLAAGQLIAFGWPREKGAISASNPSPLRVTIW